MTELADAVLPLIRTRADLHRWSTANAHGRQMHEAVGLLEHAAGVQDPTIVLAVTQKAIASAVAVIRRADDSSGIIGSAIRSLLGLHADLTRAAKPPATKLVAWMIAFQFDGKQDFFEIDPVAYAPALGEQGLALYRSKLDEIAAGLSPQQPGAPWWGGADSHTRFTLEWNARRLAVVDRDVDAVIRTHARDRKVAAWLEDTAEALAEIGQIELAIDWARQATDFDRGHQSQKAGDYWCRLLAEHRPDELLEARLEVFRRWPSSTSAARLWDASGDHWPQYRDEVFERLADRPRDAVVFALLSLKDVQLAWNLAHSLGLRDADVWELVIRDYEASDPLAVLPVLTELVEADLEQTGAQHYKLAAKRLTRMRRLAAGTDKAPDVDAFIAELRETHRRRPRLQQEFDRARLP